MGKHCVSQPPAPRFQFDPQGEPARTGAGAGKEKQAPVQPLFGGDIQAQRQATPFSQVGVKRICAAWLVDHLDEKLGPDEDPGPVLPPGPQSQASDQIKAESQTGTHLQARPGTVLVQTQKGERYASGETADQMAACPQPGTQLAMKAESR